MTNHTSNSFLLTFTKIQGIETIINRKCKSKCTPRISYKLTPKFTHLNLKRKNLHRKKLSSVFKPPLGALVAILIKILRYCAITIKTDLKKLIYLN